MIPSLVSHWSPSNTNGQTMIDDVSFKSHYVERYQEENCIDRIVLFMTEKWNEMFQQNLEESMSKWDMFTRMENRLDEAISLK